MGGKGPGSHSCAPGTGSAGVPHPKALVSQPSPAQPSSTGSFSLSCPDTILPIATFSKKHHPPLATVSRLHKLWPGQPQAPAPLMFLFNSK